MYKKKALVREEDVVLVSTAREGLPGLVNRVSQGGKPVKIGPRGKPAAVLLGIDEYEALRARAAAAKPSTWKDLEVDFGGSDVDQILEEVRRENIEAWERRQERYARDLAGHAPETSKPKAPRSRTPRRSRR